MGSLYARILGRPQRHHRALGELCARSFRLPSIARIVEGRDLPIGPPGILEWPAPYLRTIVVPGGQAPIVCHAADERVRAAGHPSRRFRLVASRAAGLSRHCARALPDGADPGLAARTCTRQSGLDRIVPSDRLGVWLLGLGLLGVLILFGVLMISFPDLPDVLTVRYNSAGLPEEIREKAALFRLPIIGLLAWGINGVAGLISAGTPPIARRLHAVGRRDRRAGILAAGARQSDH